MSDDEAQMIKDCEARESKLSDWEREFIDSIGGRDSLTERQSSRLEAIWDRVTG